MTQFTYSKDKIKASILGKLQRYYGKTWQRPPPTSSIMPWPPP